MEDYKQVCSSDDCYQIVTEDDIERTENGEIYERSRKCWDCRTTSGRQAIKKFRQKHRINKIK